MLNRTAASLLGFITRREGKKFLKLRQGIDPFFITGKALDLKQGVSLYIHIPFCKTLCPFCCFNRYLFKEDAARAYFQHLRQELDLYLQRGFQFEDFYFGGGTPTILMDELLRFIDYLRQKCHVKRVSLETTPREINPETVKLLKEAGINRLSIGVQSFAPELLKAMGRHDGSASEIKERLVMAEGQFDTLNVDFVFNFPGQTVAQFAADVATFKELGIDQATFYPLMASPHKKDALERKFNRVDTSREKRFYDIILSELYHGGYDLSTVWCFSRGKRMIDEYIVDYDDYIGIGAGSVSIVNGNFYVNSFSLDRYAELIGEKKLPIIGLRKLSESEKLRYYLLTKLFGAEVSRDRFYQRFHSSIYRKLGRELTLLKLAGIVKDGAKITLTEPGMYPVSVMMREFFAALNTLREYCIEHQI